MNSDNGRAMPRYEKNNRALHRCAFVEKARIARRFLFRIYVQLLLKTLAIIFFDVSLFRLVSF